MKIVNTRIHKLLAASLGLSAIMLPAIIAAAPGTLATQPLFTQNAVDPNIMISVDDSGSMDFEVLFTTNDGALWWENDDETFLPLTDGASQGDRKYVYLFPNGAGFANGRRSNSITNHFAIPPFVQYAYTRSPDYNTAYFNNDTKYTPWTSYVDQTFIDIVETNAPADPFHDRDNDFFDLTDTTLRMNSSGEHFRVQDKMIVPKDTVYFDGTWKTAGSDFDAGSNKDMAIEYNPATYYRVVKTGTYTVKNLSNVTTPGDCSTPNAAHYPFIEANPGSFTGTTGVDSIAPDGNCLKKYTIAAGTTGTDGMQNFANWFSYYRKRHLALRGGLTESFDDVTGVRVGIFTINDRGTVTMRDFDTEKDTIYERIYAEAVGGGTPNRTAMGHAGEQYKTNTNIITAECQKNFTIFFTDGFSTLGGPNVGNEDGTSGEPYADGYSSTLADIAMKYYTENLRTDLLPTGQVPVSSQCDVTPLDESLDCNKNLHMVTYTVGLGALGTIFNNTHFDVADAYNNKPAWPDVNNARDPRQIDDLYHAAVNGRGEMFSADTPADLATELKAVLNSITEQTGSAASVAFNTSVLSTGSVVYQARFNTDKWKGELLSYDLDPTSGDVAITASWDAAEQLPVASDRVIFTYNPDSGQNKGVQFKAGTSDILTDSTISTAAKADLNVDLPTTSGITPAELTAKDRLNYLRGDRTYEGVDDNGKARFRVRHADSVLGDIVHSAPLFVGEAVLGWPTGDGVTAGEFPGGTNSYETWSDSLSRAAMVYVGSNDGMMHGFNAETGVEKMAYIPSILYSSAANDGLHHLSEPGYTHQYYVDNTASRSDSYIKGRSSSGGVTARAWRSVLVGTLRGGGAGVFALDVTNPANFSDSATSAASTALWEFDSTDDADLGLTFSRPTIVPTNATDAAGNIRWAAIVGNGYNNGGDCHSKLFILFLDGGLDGSWTTTNSYATTDYIEIDTGVGAAGDCNGLSTPGVVDFNGDGKADAVYAGDLYGNMWNFDLCNKNNSGICQSSGWDIAYSSGNGAGATVAPLFTAKDADGTRQPITAPPIVISHPTVLSTSIEPNTLVLFGTGQYLVNGDKSDSADATATPPSPSHTYYGVWDNGEGGKLRTDLMGQVFEAGFGQNAAYRVTGLEVPKYEDPSSPEYGWYLDLPDTSDNTAAGAPERVVTRSVVLGDIVFFNTLVPTTDGCDIGGYGYLMSVETKNGGRPATSIIDRNGDGNINDSDFIDGDAVVGKQSNEGILSEPAFLGDKRYESTSKGKILKDDVDPGGDNEPEAGRYSWHEIRNE